MDEGAMVFDLSLLNYKVYANTFILILEAPEYPNIDVDITFKATAGTG